MMQGSPALSCNQQVESSLSGRLRFPGRNFQRCVTELTASFAALFLASVFCQTGGGGGGGRPAVEFSFS